MANMICIEKSKKSKVTRLPFLPRIGITIDLGGRQIIYRQAPFLEFAFNLMSRGFSKRNMIEIAQQQFREIELPKFKGFSSKVSPK